MMASVAARAMSAVKTQMVVITGLMVAGLPAMIAMSPWLLGAYVVVGPVPFATYYWLNSVKTGYQVSDEQRQKRNRKFTQNVKLLGLYNIFETATQGVIHIVIGIKYLGNISPAIIPADPMSPATWFRVAWQAWAMLFFADVANYFFHRLAHENKFLWRNMHYLHHEYAEPEHSVWSLFYVHPIEMFLSNVCFFVGIWMVNTDLFTIFLFGSLSSLEVAAGHSGFSLGGWLDAALDPAFHRIHHSMYRYNYAEHFTIIDRIMGTFKAIPHAEAAAGKDAALSQGPHHTEPSEADQQAPVAAAKTAAPGKAAGKAARSSVDSGNDSWSIAAERTNAVGSVGSH